MKHQIYKHLLLATMTFSFAQACGYESDGASQPAQTADPAAAEAILNADGRTSLSFTEDVAVIIDKHCTSCHSSYGSYEGSVDDYGEIVGTIQSGEMPPSRYAAVPKEELDILALWSEQGFPQ